MSQATQLLNAAAQGDRQAASQLLPLVYEELRHLAAAKLNHEPPGQTINATALVHEAYLRLVGTADASQWEGRQHFFGAAAEAMRRILIDRAREKQAAKRGGNLVQRELDPEGIAAPQRSEDLLVVDEALQKLEAVDPQAAKLVKLRYFVGMTIPEAADALGISPRTADAWWAYAKAWLLAELRPAVH